MFYTAQVPCSQSICMVKWLLWSFQCPLTSDDYHNFFREIVLRDTCKAVSAVFQLQNIHSASYTRVCLTLTLRYTTMFGRGTWRTAAKYFPENHANLHFKENLRRRGGGRTEHPREIYTQSINAAGDKRNPCHQHLWVTRSPTVIALTK